MIEYGINKIDFVLWLPSFFESGGCGRFFEGTAEQMHSALIGKLSQLPDDTNVYCGHEYTLQNLAFGQHIEPSNQDIAKKIQWAKTQRENNLPTVNHPTSSLYKFPIAWCSKWNISPSDSINHRWRKADQSIYASDSGIRTAACWEKWRRNCNNGCNSQGKGFIQMNCSDFYSQILNFPWLLFYLHENKIFANLYSSITYFIDLLLFSTGYTWNHMKTQTLHNTHTQICYFVLRYFCNNVSAV